jgi:hypothetical protein
MKGAGEFFDEFQIEKAENFCEDRVQSPNS